MGRDRQAEACQIGLGPAMRILPGTPGDDGMALGDLLVAAHQRVEGAPGLLRQDRDAPAP